eukprot:CAMPEP_0203784810 /NCGR_PEP_ID=MMETSP0100_2-20121128/676_1 /ASSEMBLY_ACC=CAM_ASM_000210 /TAXON_ID=96639 /ORGANISM=" , Strain NY0313808BC1" /LENGTH=37 /DNA_ID= /DNA_START= /DNA_END= /DNA_ORIENTATION=
MFTLPSDVCDTRFDTSHISLWARQAQAQKISDWATEF